ncbi:MAG: DUF6478 family protein [Albidovulum sp.]
MAARRLRRRWGAFAEAAAGADLGTLRRLRGTARRLRHDLDRLLHVAEARLTLPAIGSDSIPRPVLSDWAWRPEIWRGPLHPPGLAAVETRTPFGSGATIFHDCARSELTFRQVRNMRAEDLAPFGLRMDVFGFSGSFLSLVIDLPPEAVQGLTRRHIIRAEATVELERPLEIFARLNVRHGPNTEQLVQELPPGETPAAAEFDLAYTKLNEKRVERAWIDLIFERPEMNQILLRDLTFTRRPRADL